MHSTFCTVHSASFIMVGAFVIHHPHLCQITMRYTLVCQVCHTPSHPGLLPSRRCNFVSPVSLMNTCVSSCLPIKPIISSLSGLYSVCLCLFYSTIRLSLSCSSSKGIQPSSGLYHISVYKKSIYEYSYICLLVSVAARQHDNN